MKKIKKVAEMGLDISFFKKTEKGFEQIAYYRQSWELLSWVERYDIEERESITEKFDFYQLQPFTLAPKDVQEKMLEIRHLVGTEGYEVDEYTLYPIFDEDLENLFDRVDWTLEEDIKTTKFSNEIWLPRDKDEIMQNWDDAQFDEYISDLNSYKELLKDTKDLYIYLSY